MARGSSRRSSEAVEVQQAVTVQLSGGGRERGSSVHVEPLPFTVLLCSFLSNRFLWGHIIFHTRFESVQSFCVSVKVAFNLTETMSQPSDGGGVRRKKDKAACAEVKQIK